jgi:uncharacterized protein (DUF427 family)
MATHEALTQLRTLGELRYQPTGKRITAIGADGQIVARSDRAALVKEPRRVVDEYAIPRRDFRATVQPTPADAPAREKPWFDPADEVYPPGGFRWHTAPGSEVDVAGVTAVGFALDDADLDDYVLLDFAAFDWLEEDEPVIGHPRSPYHRVDVRRSTRHVRIERDGVLLADSDRPALAFETSLPVRYYLPTQDVRMERLTATATRTICAYKGVASYWAVQLDGDGEGDGARVADLAWGYLDPLPDARELAGLVCFYDEKVDVWVDGERQERPLTDWS